MYANINSEYDLTYTWNLLGEIVNEFSENRIQIPVTVGIGLLQGKLNFLEVQPLISLLMYISQRIIQIITLVIYMKNHLLHYSMVYL